MMKLKLVWMAFLLVSLTSRAQDVDMTDYSGEETFQNVTISYRIQRSKEKKSTDKFIMTLTIVNNNDQDLYYWVDESDVGDLKHYSVAGLGMATKKSDASFALLQVRNAAGFIKGGIVEVRGEPSGLYSEKKDALFVLRHGVTYSSEVEFKMKKDTEPVITLSPDKTMKQIEEVYNLID